MLRIFWTMLIIPIVFTPVLQANEVAYIFTGSISFSSPVFDEPAPVGEVHGRFVYDTASLATDPDPGCDCMGYRQRRSYGFTAMFGDLSVQADDYIVEVDNDYPQEGDVVADIFTVIFTSDVNPPLSKPLLVNGVPQPVGLFSFSLGEIGGTLYDDPSLPPDLELGDFHYKISILSDSPSGTSVFVTIDTLQEIQLLAGDYDYDDDVDGSDFLLWQRELGSNDLAPDGDDDGLVGPADLDLWEINFGAGSDALDARETTVVPEPSSSLLLLSVALLTLSRLRAK